jgi:putative N6-adenine-specific DNA methylase
VAGTPPPTVAAFAIAAPGLEALVAAELNRLGIAAAVEAGGAAWSGTLETVARANLWLRTASRVIVRVAVFRARTFHELERHARKLPWERFVSRGAQVRFRVTSRKSRLYHTDAIAQRLADAAVTRVGVVPARDRSRDAGRAGTRDEDDVYDHDDEAGAQLFVVRVVRDVCTVSADSSGALLHRRGYRQAVAKAPLRETIAAAMLLASEWPGTVPLVDPMCGSGTIPIEAALLARRIAPGVRRRFAFDRWPDFDAAIWARIVGEAREQELPSVPTTIRGSDRDAGAVEAALANAERAGVAADVELDRRPLSAIEPPPAPGWIVTNPPYGVRVAEARGVRDLYAALGKVLRARFAGWTLALLSPAESLERQVGLMLRERFATLNGGISVRLVTGEVRA